MPWTIHELSNSPSKLTTLITRVSVQVEGFTMDADGGLPLGGGFTGPANCRHQQQYKQNAG